MANQGRRKIHARLVTTVEQEPGFAMAEKVASVLAAFEVVLGAVVLWALL